MPYRLTIDNMPGGNHDREPEIQEFESALQAIGRFEYETGIGIAPFELTLYQRKEGSLQTLMIRRLTVLEDV